jgi:hypothetical protein
MFIKLFLHVRNVNCFATAHLYEEYNENDVGVHLLFFLLKITHRQIMYFNNSPLC